MAEDDTKSEVQGSSVEAAIETSVGCAATESTCNNNNGNSAESSAVADRDEREKSLVQADELIARGSKAAKERDYAEATDCYSRALEIRVAHFGELAPECVNAYYKYGCALLYKAQEEADPFGSIPKKEGVSQEDSNKEGSVKIAPNCESSAASVSNNDEQGGNADCSNAAPENSEDESDDGDEPADGDEDESDLDLAWKMLDIARAIVEKLPADTMEKVDILSALAEVALEREDVETSMSDYSKAISILERLVVPDSRFIAELICLCLEIGSKPQEAIPYCQKAISICKSRVQRLTDEVKNLPGPAETQTASESGQFVRQSSSTSISVDSVKDKEAEIETLTGLCGELEKKLEDLQQLVSNPKSIISDIMEIMAAKAKATEKSGLSIGTSSLQVGTSGAAGSTSSVAVSTGDTNVASGVTHLGVVGRGVKRVVMSSAVQPGPAKKPTIDPSSNNGDDNTS
ncbi:hypothetical protein CASFOL_015220 [Castilleja foliolosa]|uniref:Uncharacterized protein n=1 Tax=Castilleja foliolosa TaxID=1961234 RepID=A0ABD3DEX0_9LAMI